MILPRYGEEGLGNFEKPASFPAGTRADVRAVELDVAELFGEFALPGVRMASHRWFKLGQLDGDIVNELLLFVARDRFVRFLGPVELAAVIDVGLGLAIELENTIL